MKNISELPPIPTIQILSQNEEITLSTVKDFILSSVIKEEEEIEKEEKANNELIERVKERNNHIRQLTNITQFFPDNECSRCHQPLTVPSVFFMCGHSFHKRCLMDEKRCNECWALIEDVQQRKQLMRNTVLANTPISDQASLMSPELSFGGASGGVSSSLKKDELSNVYLTDGDISNTAKEDKRKEKEERGGNRENSNINRNKVSKEYDSFMEQVSDGGFNVIVEYFGKGYFDKVYLFNIIKVRNIYLLILFSFSFLIKVDGYG